MAYFGGRAIAVVGERLDEDSDAFRAVALVHDGLEVRGVRALAGTARDCALDVVLRHRIRPRLLDRVLKGKVVRRIRPTLLRRDDDRARELREELAALDVGGAFL